MDELRVFVDINDNTLDKVIICRENAEKLGLKNGVSVEVENPDNKKKISASLEISDIVLDFAAQVSKNIVDDLEFSGVELIIRPLAKPTLQPPEISMPKIPTLGKIPGVQPIKTEPIKSTSFTPLPTPPAQKTTPETSAPVIPDMKTDFPKPTPPPQLKPMEPPKPTIPTQVQPPVTPTQPPQPMPMPMGTPTKPPIQAPTQPSTTLKAPTPPSQVSQAQPIQAEPYPNKIDVNILQQQIGGIVLKPVIDDTIEGGRVRLNSSIIQNLGIGPGMLVGWEDPLTRAKGSARVEDAPINASEIHMSRDTKEDTNIQSQYIVVYSAEPPIQKVSKITLEVQSQPNLMGYCLVSPRIGLSLDLKKDDIVAFEDELTGATAAGKIEIVETLPDNVIMIDSEILEASGIGSFEVKVMKNHRPIVPLQKISLGITPITGENVWEIVSSARENITSLKAWLENYIIFKGIKLRWSAVNIACSVLNTVPDLTGDVFAQVTQNTTINLTPMGLIPFNAILIIDISRSMMARDVLATNIAPAIEGIKAAMESREIQEFLKHFKPNINVPRRIAAAFAAVLFLSEKVGRGFGEKVAVIRFADEAQILPFGNSFYMDSASGKKGVLEDAARMIVDRIANAYGQATNMGAALLAAHQILNEFEKMNPDQPTMIVLLTDGEPTDGDAFFENIKLFAQKSNVILYIVGLGNPNDELMTKAAQLCGGEYFKPADAGELLVWYSKRARDLTVKLKAHREEV